MSIRQQRLQAPMKGQQPPARAGKGKECTAEEKMGRKILRPIRVNVGSIEVPPSVKMKKKASAVMTNKQLEATAYHEAGHAVLGVFFGWKLRAVTIVPREGAAGLVLHYLKRSIEIEDWGVDYAEGGSPQIIT